MEMLYHAFPRPRKRITTEGTKDSTSKGMLVLKLILDHGLLCSPEALLLYPDPATERYEKLKLHRDGQPHDRIIQSRACFTLVNREELNREIELSTDLSILENKRQVPLPSSIVPAHVDLFGQFAIGLDPLEARDIGILPVHYFYNAPIPVGSTWSRTRVPPDFCSQLVARLDELRNLMAILSHIEAIAQIAHSQYGTPNLSRQDLARLGVVPKFEPQIERLINNLSVSEANKIFQLFNSDRVFAWNLFDYINMILSTYQTTDSTINNEPLAFFRQHEWRLILHMRSGLEWFCLGNQPIYADPYQYKYASNRREIRNFMENQFGSLDEDKMRNFWVLSNINGQPTRNYIREIVAPTECLQDVKDMVHSCQFSDRRPHVCSLAPKWRIKMASRSVT